MKTFISASLVFLFACTLYGQPGPDTLWTRFYGWTGDDTAFCLQKTADRGFIIAGTATVPADGRTNAFLIKADSAGIMQGFHSYGGTATDEGAYSVVVAADGGYAFAGYSTNTTGFRRNYVVRVNILGEVICTWIDSVQVPYQLWSTSIAKLQDNSFVSVVIIGSYSEGYSEAALERIENLTCDANILSYLDRYNLMTHAIRQTSDLGLVVVGQFSDTTISPRLAFLSKLSLSGSFIHSYSGDGNEDDARDFVETPTGFVMAGSSYDGHVDGIFICKTDTSGDPDWIHRFFLQQSQWAEAIIPALGGGYVIAGTRENYFGNTDMYLAKVNDDGAIVWQNTYGTAADERAYDVVQTSDGGFVLCGYSNAHLGVGTEWYIVKTLPDPSLSEGPFSALLPHQFTLSCFPNPFNPTTTLAFTLPQTGQVKVVVYDLLGREVAVLAERVFEAGEQRLRFDGSALPSGLYFARMQAGGLIATQKLLLLR
jgi:hypothetical protein